jgi:hypothetical protein
MPNCDRSAQRVEGDTPDSIGQAVYPRFFIGFLLRNVRQKSAEAKDATHNIAIETDCDQVPIFETAYHRLRESGMPDERAEWG